MKEQFTVHPVLVKRSALYSYEKAGDLSIERLKILLLDHNFLRALWVASPVVYQESQKWINNTLEEKRVSKLVLSLSKYYLRYISRVTPFGLFAGCGTIDTSGEQPASNGRATRIRLDMEFLCSYVLHLEQNGHLRKKLRYKTNSSLYAIHNQYRYYESKLFDNKKQYSLSAIENDEYTHKIISFCKKQYNNFNEIAAQLVEDDITIVEAEAFINDLIDNQVLISELEPDLTSDDCLKELIKKLQPLQFALLKHDLDILAAMEGQIDAINQKGEGEVRHFESLVTMAEKLGLPFNEGKLIQLDTSLLPSGTPSVLKPEHLALLKRLPAKFEPLMNFSTSNNLTAFASKFKERYEEAEVPLTTLLDADSGIGYPISKEYVGDRPLVDGIRFSNIPGEGIVTAKAADIFLLHKVIDAQINGSHTIELTDHDLDKIGRLKKERTDIVDMQPTLCVTFNLLRENSEKYILLNVLGSNSGTNLIGRFGFFEGDFTVLLHDIAEHEQKMQPDMAFAEIYHLPENNRAGNVISRPHIYEYQIPFLANCSSANENIIPVDDIWVSIGKGGEILLRSKKYNKYITPRLSCAQNYHRSSIPVYHFLCDLQNQHKLKGFIFSWSTLMEGFTFLPRLTLSGNIIVSLAEWRVRMAVVKDIIELYKKKGAAVDITDRIREWRIKNKIPRKVFLEQGEFRLLIDLDNELNCQVLFETVRNQPTFILKEFLEPDDENNHMSEYMAVLMNHQQQSNVNKLNPGNTASEGDISRKLVPGSKAAYFKIYGGNKILEKILVDEIYPLMQYLQKEKIIHKWFFVRYKDDDNHLRLRLFFREQADISEALKRLEAIFQRYIDANLLANVVLDTYKREVERYHKDYIEEAEAFFHYDSECIAEILALIENTGLKEDYRWQAGLLNVKWLVSSMFSDPAVQLEFLSKQRNGYFNEYGGGTTLIKSISAKYLLHKKQIGALFTDSTADEVLSDINRIYQKRAAAISSMLHLISNNVDIQTFQSIMSSYIHMSQNRIFITDQRVHEFICYDFTERVYQSLSARKKQLI